MVTIGRGSVGSVWPDGVALPLRDYDLLLRIEHLDPDGAFNTVRPSRLPTHSGH